MCDATNDEEEASVVQVHTDTQARHSERRPVTSRPTNQPTDRLSNSIDRLRRRRRRRR